MKVQAISDTATNLGSVSPWLVGSKAVAVNLTAGSLDVKTSDDGVTYATAATCGASTSATAMQEFTVKKYVKVGSAATMFILTSQ